MLHYVGGQLKPDFPEDKHLCRAIPRKHAQIAPAAFLARVLLRNFCLRKRPSFLASQRFAQENPTPCLHYLSGFNSLPLENDFYQYTFPIPPYLKQVEGDGKFAIYLPLPFSRNYPVQPLIRQGSGKSPLPVWPACFSGLQNHIYR
jgi:hypothetical protein